MSIARRTGLILTCSVLTAGTLGACGSTTTGTPQSPTHSAAPGGFPATSGSAAPSGSTAPSGSPATSGSPAATPPTSGALSKIVLTAADLPTAWTSVAYHPDPTDAANQAKFAQCTGTRNTEADKVAEVHSPDFSSGNATVSSGAASYKSTADVDVDRAALTSPKATSCYQQLARSQIATSLPGGITIDKLDLQVVAPAAGDPANVVGRAQVKVVVANSGQQLTVYTDAVFLGSPFVEAEIDFTNVGSAVPTALQARLVKTMSERLARS